MKKVVSLLLCLVMLFSITIPTFAAEKHIEVRLCNYVNSEGDLVNEKYIDFDVEPQMINDRVMIPIRFVAEELGYEVGWIDNTLGKIVTVAFKAEKEDINEEILNKKPQLKSLFSLIEKLDKGEKVSNFENRIFRYSISQPKYVQKINNNVNFNTILNCNYMEIYTNFVVERTNRLYEDYFIDITGRDKDYRAIETLEATYNFDVTPQIIEDRTLVPLRAVGEMLGLEVEWDGVNRIVTLSVK